MKSKTALSLIISLILMVGHLPFVIAVSDVELEALEKQIEQLESEEKKQTEAEAKRKDEQKRKVEAEAKRKKEEEVKRMGEAEAKRKAEEASLAEIERQRREDEVKKKAKEEAQKREEAKREQFSQYMKNGDSAMNNKKYTEALRIYTQALEIFPGDSEALTGQSSAREFQDICAALVGEWDWAFDIFVIVSADGNLQAKALISNHGTWECTNPSQRKFTLHWVVGGWVDTVTLSTDGNTLDGVNNIGFQFQAWRKGTKEWDPSREVPL